MVRRKMLLSIVVVGMISSAAFALVPMGPPMAGLPQGQYAVGGGYAFSDMTLEVSGPGGTSAGEGVLNDVQSDIWYGGLGYGISDAWNIFGGVGTANAEFPGDAAAPDFDGSSDFAYGIGVKRTLATDEESGIVWGTLFQYSHFKSEDRITQTASGQTWGNQSISLPGSAGSRPETKLKWYEIQLAVGPTIPVCDGVSVYGGPFLHLLEGDLEIKYPGGSNTRAEYELEQNLELGGYIGALVELGSPDATLGVEFLWTGNAWGAGIGLNILCP